MKQERNLLHIEFIRIIATFWVIFNHTGIRGFFLFSTYEAGGIYYWIALAMSIFCKAAVPLFFMITGALLLQKEYSLKTIWKKKILKIVIVLVVFSLFFYVRKYLTGISSELSLKGFVVKLYEGSIKISFWYLYAYIALLISIPFLQGIVKNLTDKLFLYLLGISFLFISVLPCIEFILWQGKVSINTYISVTWLMSNIVIYPITGYYLENQLDINQIKKKHIIAFWFLSILGLAVSSYMTYYKQTITGLLPESASQEFHNTFILYLCITIYITIKYLYLKVNDHKIINNLIASIGSCTFGIYLIHSVILDSKFISNLWSILIDKLHISRMLSPLIISFVVLLAGYIIIFLLRKLPIVRKFI